jgi:hypothetical protein
MSNANSITTPCAETAQAFPKHRVKVPRLEFQDGKNLTSFELSKLVAKIPAILGIKRAVLRALADHYPNIWPSVETLAHEAGFGTTATRKYLRELEIVDKFIKPIGARKGGRNVTEQYVIDVKAIFAAIPKETQRDTSGFEQNPTRGEQNPTPGVAEQRSNKELKEKSSAAASAAAAHFPISDELWEFLTTQLTEEDRTRLAFSEEIFNKTRDWNGPRGTDPAWQSVVDPPEVWLNDSLNGFWVAMSMDYTGDGDDDFEWEWWNEPQDKVDGWFLNEVRSRVLSYGNDAAERQRWNAIEERWRGRRSPGGRDPECSKKRACSVDEKVLPLPFLQTSAAVVTL